MRLIDSDPLFDKTIAIEDADGNETRAVLLSDILDAPSIDYQPVKHRRWFNLHNGFYRCPNCYQWSQQRTEYCPHCGTCMDEDRWFIKNDSRS